MSNKLCRYRIDIEYHGGDFCGWQHQNGMTSVQSVIEDAIKLMEFPIINRLIVAGRTDAGVHALNQVAHFDADEEINERKFFYGINYLLRKKRIAIKNIEAVKDDFHARFDATSRTYLYRIICRESHLIFDKDRAWHIKCKKLDVASMRKAARLMIGEHDFQSFRSTDCQAKNAVRTLDFVDINSIDDANIEILFQARSFLHNQVRIMIGTLYEIGIGRWSVNKIIEIFDAKNRISAGRTAPACGLFLKSVNY